MTDRADFPWRGDRRLTSIQLIPEGAAPLAENEQEAIDGWLPKGVRVLTHARGRTTCTDRPLWVVTSAGVLIASLTSERDGQLRARVNWIPSAHMRRVDLITNNSVALLRVLSASRRFVLLGCDEISATRFAVFARTIMTAEHEGRQQANRRGRGHRVVTVDS